MLAELPDRSPQAGRKKSETSLKFDSKESTSGGPTFAGHRMWRCPAVGILRLVVLVDDLEFRRSGEEVIDLPGISA